MLSNTFGVTTDNNNTLLYLLHRYKEYTYIGVIDINRTLVSMDRVYCKIVINK